MTVLNEPRWTHVALPVSELDRSVEFYERLTSLVVVRRVDGENMRVAWLSNKGQVETPFVLVLGQFLGDAGLRFGVPSGGAKMPILAPWAHLGIEVPDRSDVDRIAARAHEIGSPPRWEPMDMGEDIGYTTAVTDPDGNTVEFAHNQGIFSHIQELWG
ncbi:VOC family protein [Amycolatopsis sp. cmx-4-54]|uniref:VOC family protein n=1 Tax=Amycolatopsis sp. cmx-4-54 TaxID=2790936 RepID=UPI0039788EF2